ncbi:hypothetical protein KTT_49520 [Tengunoibacter tsumagoiensis]|uniref:PPM-type phosphatase domain-containing protein n=2 Tax=Tengunoibacter tsumagoiensis TaxID=2014871 RepID=A0A402A7I7_9CHLR|nr:hypothetical protein KTT_49520 [Tengunoibacter tsumagoiensis]
MIHTADKAIASLEIPPEEKRPATTAALVVLSLQQDQVYATTAHIGDSRIYLLRSEALQRLTEDNGYFPFAVRRGIITKEASRQIEQAERASDLSPEEQAHFARRHQITCAVGWSDFPRIQTRSLALVPGDTLVVCTDGVHDNLTDHEIATVLHQSDENKAQRLVSAAYQRSQQMHFRAKPDDITAIVVSYS